MTDDRGAALATRATQPADAPEIVRCARDVLEAEWTPAFVGWKYFDNPAGRVYGRRAELDGCPAGFYGNIPLHIKVGDRVVRGAQAVDAMVAPEARRHGVFVRLAQETFRDMDAAGVELDYVFPSPAARAGFVERLGWTTVGAVPRYTLVLSPSALTPAGKRAGFPRQQYVWLFAAALIRLSRLRSDPARAGQPGAPIVREVAGFDARFDRLWDEAAADFPIAVVRDAAYLNWRYAMHPTLRYHILAAEQNGRVMGFAVLSPRDFERSRALALAELLSAPGALDAGMALLAAAAVHARRLGAAQVHCWMLPRYALYRRLLTENGFVHWPWPYVPGALRYSVPFLVRPRPRSTLAADPAALATWYLAMGDHDYY